MSISPISPSEIFNKDIHFWVIEFRKVSIIQAMSVFRFNLWEPVDEIITLKSNCSTDFTEWNNEWYMKLKKDFRSKISNNRFLLTYVSKIVGREFLCKTFSLIKSFFAKWRLHIERDLTFRSMTWCFSIALAHCCFFSPSLDTLKEY